MFLRNSIVHMNSLVHTSIPRPFFFSEKKGIQAHCITRINPKFISTLRQHSSSCWNTIFVRNDMQSLISICIPWIFELTQRIRIHLLYSAFLGFLFLLFLSFGLYSLSTLGGFLHRRSPPICFTAGRF